MAHEERRPAKVRRRVIREAGSAGVRDSRALWSCRRRGWARRVEGARGSEEMGAPTHRALDWRLEMV